MKNLMDFKGFKKVADDEHKATLQHPDGHQIHLVKSVISPKLKVQLDKLPLHQKDGGPIEDPLAEPDTSTEIDPTGQGAGSGVMIGADKGVEGTNPAVNPLSSFDQLNQSLPNPPPSATTPQPTDLGQNMSQSSPNVPLAPSANPNGQYGTIPGIPEQIQAQQNLASHESQGQKAIADLAANAAKEDADRQKAFEVDQASKTVEINNLTKDALDKHINPNQYMESLGTGGKIATAIGLILGGIGGGQMHQANPALQFLNAQIERDLESQKANMGNKQNVLSALMKQYGNAQVAENMFRAFKHNYNAELINSAIAKTGSKTAIDNGLNAVGLIKNKAIPQLIQHAAFQQLSGAPSQSGQQPQQADPSRQLRLQLQAGLIDKDTYDKAVTQLDDNSKVEEIRADLKNSFEDINSKFANGLLSPADRQRALDLHAGQLGQITTHRFNLDESKKQIGAILPNRFEGQETSEKKYNDIDRLLDSEKKTSLLDSLPYPIKVPRKDISHVQGPNNQVFNLPGSQVKSAISQGFKRVNTKQKE